MIRTIAALAAAAGLLFLTACGGGGGGGGGGPSTSMPSAPTPTIGSVQSADPAKTTGAAAQVADNLPAFGSVTQSSNGGSVSGITTDAASTSFDGSNVQLTVRRADGSSLRLNSASHREDSVSGASDIPGHDTIRGDLLLDYSNTRATAAAVYVSWDNADPTDYLAGGYWLHARGDFSTATITGIEVGAFMDGPELDGPASIPVNGSASYQGPTEGLFAQQWGTDDPNATPGTTMIGGFTGTIDLTADFGANTISGCVGCSGPLEIVGIAEDGRTGETAEVTGYSASVLRLGPAAIGSDGTFRNRQMSMTHPSFAITSTTGSWGGKLSNVPDATGDPRLVAGTYGGRAVTSGGTESVFVGAYYANKR